MYEKPLINARDLELLAMTDVNEALSLAAKEDNANIARILIEEKGANISAIKHPQYDYETMQTPFKEALTHNSFNVMKLMIEKGADINSYSFDVHSVPLTTLLINSSRDFGSSNCIKFLLIKGASVDYKFWDVLTPAEYAFRHASNDEYAKWIIIAGSDSTEGRLTEREEALKERTQLENISKLSSKEELFDAITSYFSENLSNATLHDKLNYFLIYSCRSHNTELKKYGHCLNEIMDKYPKSSAEDILKNFLDACQNYFLPHTLRNDLKRFIQEDNKHSNTSVACNSKVFSLHQELILTRAYDASGFFRVKHPNHPTPEKLAAAKVKVDNKNPSTDIKEDNKKKKSPGCSVM